jgi:catechol 2,3-dioxygenase-like lactoylglutathione lyase family enzyme
MSILYVTLGTNDAARAKRFYDAALGALGFRCKVNGEHGMGYVPAVWPEGSTECLIWVEKPFLDYPATWGNGTMIALPAETRQQVRDFHAAAVANGGADDGQPGLRRYHENFYACYVRDPDGNKLSVVCEKAE